MSQSYQLPQFATQNITGRAQADRRLKCDAAHTEVQALQDGALKAALERLQSTPPENRLAQLEELCLVNGTWSVPVSDIDQRPILYEIDLLGVSASAETLDALAHHWMCAARQLLTPETPDADIRTLPDQAHLSHLPQRSGLLPEGATPTHGHIPSGFFK